MRASKLDALFYGVNYVCVQYQRFSLRVDPFCERYKKVYTYNL